MRLDMAHLAAFAAVVEEGSFEAAARRLHVTPSAVSQRIKALEARMGQVLVKRTRPTQATEAGQVLVRFAGQIALLEGQVLATLAGGAHGGPHPLRLPIAVNADSLATWFLPALAGLTAGQAMCFDLHQEDQDHSAALLRDGSVMAAVTADPQAVQGCSVQRLGAMRYVAVASPAFHRRHLADGLTSEALARAPMLIFNRKDRLQQRFAELVSGHRLDPPVTLLPSSVAFVEAAGLGLGWGMVPTQMAQPEIDAARLVEIVPDRRLDVPLYWQRWRLDSPVLNALTESVQTTAAASLN